MSPLSTFWNGQFWGTWGSPLNRLGPKIKPSNQIKLASITKNTRFFRCGKKIIHIFRSTISPSLSLSLFFAPIRSSLSPTKRTSKRMKKIHSTHNGVCEREFVCVCLRERVCMCVTEWEKEREYVCVCERRQRWKTRETDL